MPGIGGGIARSRVFDPNFSAQFTILEHIGNSRIIFDDENFHGALRPDHARFVTPDQGGALSKPPFNG
jgi:hypothetical protein